MWLLGKDVLIYDRDLKNPKEGKFIDLNENGTAKIIFKGKEDPEDICDGRMRNM